MNEKLQSIEYTCSSGLRIKPDGTKEPVLVFGCKISDDGTVEMIVSPWPSLVPVNEIYY